MLKNKTTNEIKEYLSNLSDFRKGEKIKKLLEDILKKIMTLIILKKTWLKFKRMF